MAAFGDKVRIRATEETQTLGLAGLTGSVTGFTTPSVTRFPVVGPLAEDYAVAVWFTDRNEDFWFAPELLEFVDHGGGQVITIDGVDKKIIRNDDGSWREEYFDNPRKKPKRWWRFW